MNSIDLGILSQGGPVMWLLLVVSVAGVVLFVERMLFLHRGQIRSTAFLDGIKNILAKRRLMEAVTVCEETPGPAAAIVKAALLHHDAGESKLRLAVQEAALTEIPILERRVGSLAAIAQAAPLIGLLGTVLGMMATFQAFTQGGNYAAPGALADGMWQALLTTAGGLTVGVLAHCGHHFLTGRVRALVRDMEWVANEIMRYLLIEMPTTGKGGADDGHTAA
ncbi:MAG TPA: MotA/TolQ/ExbB proton channel family protein [Opitutaceae bacterium]|nr:MotA/TolQ/ExbB proton channel family protein [Opitutaceae bacterium]